MAGAGRRLGSSGSRRSAYVLGIVVFLAAVLTQSLVASQGDWRIITSKRSGLCLEVAFMDGGVKVELKQGANIQQGEYLGHANQQWFLEPVGSGYHKIVNRRSGMCLEVAEWEGGQMVALKEGTNVRQWEYVAGQNQQWKVESVGDQYVRIVNRRSGMCLEVAEWDQGQMVALKEGTNVRQWGYVGGDNQLWSVGSGCMREADFGDTNGSFDLAIDLGWLTTQPTVCIEGAVAGWKDFYKFHVPTGWGVILTTTSDGYADTELRLWDASRKEIAYNDDAPGTLLSKIAMDLAPGTYYVAVTGIGSSTGNPYRYTLHIAVTTDDAGDHGG